MTMDMIKTMTLAAPSSDKLELSVLIDMLPYPHTSFNTTLATVTIATYVLEYVILFCCI